MKRKKTIHKIRAFNRLYMPSMKLLGNHYLGSEYSVPEARVFFEIYENEGCTAASIAKAMNLDKSYLSRIVKRHEADGYLYREPSDSDGRALRLFLTEKGRRRAKELIRKSDEEIGEIIAPLNSSERKALFDALSCVQELLGIIEARKEEAGV